MSDNLSVTCPNCGAVLPEGLEACSHCGALLAQPEQERRGYPPVEVPSSPDRHVQRTFTARIDLQVPQRAADTQGLLTPEQWQRLLDSCEAALAAQMRADMERGQPPRPIAELAVAVPWEQVGDTLRPGQRAEVEQRLRALLGSATSTVNAPAGLPATIAPPPRMKRKGSATCLVVVFMVGSMTAGVTAYLLVR